jgi:hypothetical protein
VGERQADLYKFKASLVYKLSSRTARDTQRNLVLKNPIRKKKDGETEAKLHGVGWSHGSFRVNCPCFKKTSLYTGERVKCFLHKDKQPGVSAHLTCDCSIGK